MALISLFFKKPQLTQVLRTINGSVTPVVLDATMKESFTGTAEPTQHPVENGADVTDHVIIRPKSLAISGMITQHPFGGASDLVKAAGATAGSVVGQKLGAFGGAAGAVLGGLGAKSLANALFGSTDRSLGAIAEEFVKLRDARTPVDIQTGLKLYKNFVLSSFTISRDQKTGASINVDLEFKEMIFASSQITQVAIPKVKGAVGALNAGRQSKEGLSDDENGQGASILKHLAGQA